MNIILISIYEIPPREWLPCTTIICNHSERTIHETISSLKEGAFYFLLHRFGASPGGEGWDERVSCSGRFTTHQEKLIGLRCSPSSVVCKPLALTPPSPLSPPSGLKSVVG